MEMEYMENTLCQLKISLLDFVDVVIPVAV